MGETSGHSDTRPLPQWESVAPRAVCLRRSGCATELCLVVVVRRGHSGSQAELRGRGRGRAPLTANTFKTSFTSARASLMDGDAEKPKGARCVEMQS
ncbi:hypothetical protein AAFF_G00193480 [Aldrovandia affinis]|uniref:Uncharacterized protein n=1 Tax=Aldrovandia affinis TaxID=143900 RepID=A0AAD7WW48_9TELE|nr:hypothetical protein AAFF_G00193480 [Aldrovandia affinis]